MNVAVRIRDRPLPLTRLLLLLEGRRLVQVIARAAEKLNLNHIDVARACAQRLHMRGNGGFVIDVSCGNALLFVEIASGDLRELDATITHRHEKQQNRLGQDVPLHTHVDEAAACIVRLKGEDELVDGLSTTLSQSRFGQVELTQAELLAHRLNRRAVIGVTKSNGTRAVIKAYKKGSQKALNAVKLHEVLGHTAFNERSHVRVPKIIARYTDWPGYMMERVRGTPVADITGATRRDGMRLAGEALGRLHRLPLRLESQHKQIDELNLLQSWMLLACELFPHRIQTLSKVFAHVSRLLESSQIDASESIVHRDFHGAQVLVAPGVATLIDFDTACNGEPAQDIGNFLAHLDYSQELNDADSASDAGAFIDAYNAAHTQIPVRRIQAHRAATLARLSCIHAISTESRKAAEALTERALSL